MSDVVIAAENTLTGELTSGQNLNGNMTPNTDDYEAFKNKPKINGVELVGDKSTDELGIVVIGKKTPENGEIFNDYNNKAIGEFSHAEGTETIAGTYAFNITAWNKSNRTYTLDSVDGLAVGDVFSVKWHTSHINYGRITAIDGNTITVDEIIINEENFSPKKLFIIQKPTIGTEPFDKGAHAEGWNTQAVLYASHAEGGETKALDGYAHAEGRDTQAGYSAHSEGRGTRALGEMSHAEGGYTESLGHYSHAEGYKTQALSTGSGRGASHAEGGETIADGQRSHAEGSKSKAWGFASHSEGLNTRATGDYSHAEGYVEGVADDFGAKGKGSHSEGYNTLAMGAYAHAEGNSTKALGDGSHAEGTLSKATALVAHAEGYQSQAGGAAAHAEGTRTRALNERAHAEGGETLASGRMSHAEGDHTVAKGESSHAEGIGVTSSTKNPLGGYLPDENYGALGKASHAEGGYTTATGEYSHAGGLRTKATAQAQTALGKYNKEDVDALLIIGNGTGDSESGRKNAFVVKNNGSAEIQMVSISPNSVVTKEYVDSSIGDIETVLDAIIAIQNSLIGGENV